MRDRGNIQEDLNIKLTMFELYSKSKGIVSANHNYANSDFFNEEQTAEVKALFFKLCQEAGIDSAIAHDWIK